MSNLPQAQPVSLKRPSIIGCELTGSDLQNLATKGLYLAITIVIVQSICVGIYRCMRLRYSLPHPAIMGPVLTSLPHSVLFAAFEHPRAEISR